MVWHNLQSYPTLWYERLLQMFRYPCPHQRSQDFGTFVATFHAIYVGEFWTLTSTATASSTSSGLEMPWHQRRERCCDGQNLQEANRFMQGLQTIFAIKCKMNNKLLSARIQTTKTDDNTGLPAYREDAGPAKYCRCNQKAPYCVTVSKHFYCMMVQLVQKSVTVRGELLTVLL